MNQPIRAYTYVREVRPVSELQSEFLIRAHALWDEKRNGRMMPSREDFDPETLREFLGKISLFDVEYDPLRFRCRLVGTGITTVTGRDITGQYLDEFYDPDDCENILRSFKHVIEHREPVRTGGTMSHVSKAHLRVESLDMPLSNDDETVTMILKVNEFVNG